MRLFVYCDVRTTMLFLACLPLFAVKPPAAFIQHSIATDLKGGYQVAAVDVNHDGKTDLIALGSGMKELVWYENPTWKRHVIAGNFSGMINLAAWDFDGDGIPEIVLASDFAMDPRKSVGLVSVLKHNGDPRQPWTVTEIDRVPSSHRLRIADIHGDGKPVVVNQPLAGADALPPEYRGHTPLYYYKPGEWKRELAGDQNEGVVHGLYIFDWDGDGRDDILTGSFVGIDLYRLGKDGRWTRTELAKGDPAPWPKSGSSDIAVGHLGKRRFIASIEPWHGNEVAIYRLRKKVWQRQMIDDSLVQGHTVQTADLNGDGADEVVVGFRGTGHSVYIYSAEDSSGNRWSRRVLDNAVPANACVVADLNGDGRPDIACIGGAQLKWYENER